MARIGLCGASYTSQSPNADAQKTLNWYPEILGEGAKSRVALYPTPGLKVWASLDKPVRSLLVFNGRFFAIGGAKFYELDSNGNILRINPVANDGQIAFLVAGQTQIFVVSATVPYVFDMVANTWTVINSGVLTNVAMGEYSDGYFFALIKGTNTFRISSLLDATSWPGLQLNAVSVFPDNLTSMVVDHRELFVASAKNAVGYYNSGSSNIYDVIPQSYQEDGICAPLSRTKFDNSVGWLVGNDRGSAMAVKMDGYSAKRISDHGTEFAWSQYSTVTDAIGYAYQDQGHTFWVLFFPTANKTWVYDVATQWWHERASTKGAHLSQVHAFAFNKHLVGDWASGNIYEMSIKYFDDAGSPIIRVRRAPHVSIEQERVFHESLQIDVETGLGPSVALLDGNGKARDPQMFLRWSDDGGHTWSNQYTLNCGQVGQFKKRAIRYRLGVSRDRVYEISVSDPIQWRIIDAYLKATPGFSPTERLSSQLGKSA